MPLPFPSPMAFYCWHLTDGPKYEKSRLVLSGTKMESARHCRRPSGLNSTLPPTLTWLAHRSGSRGVQQTDRRTNGYRWGRLMSPTPFFTGVMITIGVNRDSQWSGAVKFDFAYGRQNAKAVAACWRHFPVILAVVLQPRLSLTNKTKDRWRGIFRLWTSCMESTDDWTETLTFDHFIQKTSQDTFIPCRL